MDTQSFQTEVKRKLFHLTGLIYVIGLFYFPRRLFIISLVGLLVVEIVVEMLRLRQDNIRHWFTKTFAVLLRDHEQNSISGATWMTLGVVVTAYLVGPVLPAATAILFLIFGDGVASLAGKFLGGPRWPKSPKRISGSLGCFLVCLLVGQIVMRPLYGWNGIALGAFTATFFELVDIKINDNFLIPVAAGIAFVLTYNLPTV